MAEREWRAEVIRSIHGDLTVVPRMLVEHQEVRGRFRRHLVAEEVWRAGRLAASADHLQPRRTQLCSAAEYLQHQLRYGGADADDLCDRRAKAGTGSGYPERGQHLVLVFLGAGGGFGPRRAAHAVGERRRRLGDQRSVVWTSDAHYADSAILVMLSDP